MYLKKIEAQGFKSFANKMVLEFNPGIMGIVGPNGSGKSNVADAVRWVLGEQSAKSLRGNNMQDVIFAGTENRKPQGYAYVGLTIDNSDHMLAIDFDEVTISRRVYRSGESEYLINGGACRLKDIYELFYDTGVGKEGYSIIGQGQIDRILSGKPEERRELFDEAAGIVKFKKRRQVAAKKLESEETNLVRVSDILGELEKQVGPLEKQAEKAREYLKLKEELKTLDNKGVRIYFGAEAEFHPVYGVALTEENAEKFDYIIVPNSHTHMTMDKSLYEPYQKHVDFMVEAYKKILKSPVSRYILSMAHPFDAVCCPYDIQVLYKMIPDDVFKELFDATAEKGIAVEINTSCFKGITKENFEQFGAMRMFRIAREMGCKFTFGSDSHSETGHDTYMQDSKTIIDCLDIKVNDLAEMVRPIGGSL